MPNASLAELARRTGHSKKAIEKFCQLNGIEVAGEAPVNQEPTVIKVTATVSDPSAGRWVEPLPPIPLLPADELRWAIETFRSLGPGLPDKYATWGPLGVFVWYRDAFWAQLDELGKLEDKVKSLGRAAQYRRAQHLEQKVRELEIEKDRTIDRFQQESRYLQDERDRRGQTISNYSRKDKEQQMQLNAAHARLPAIDRGLDLEQARRIHEAEERGRAQGEARMYSILTPEEISSREAQLAEYGKVIELV
ncbi:MAG: hypothetical protein WAN74_05925 [Thermoplasmata archaeon]